MRIFAIGVTAFLALATAPAGSRPDFSGDWVLDKNRSFSNPPGLDQTMTIVHNGEEVGIKARITSAQGERMIEEAWTLDGKEREFTPSGAPQGGKGKRKAFWLPENRGVVVVEETTTDATNGPVTQQTTRKFTLSPDAITLTVDYFFDGPRGPFEAKRIFVKK
jgi:hypothetical protein